MLGEELAEDELVVVVDAVDVLTLEGLAGELGEGGEVVGDEVEPDARGIGGGWVTSCSSGAG